MNHSGPGLGLQRLVQGKWISVVMPSFDGTSLSVSALLLDRDGALWIGTESQGIYRIHDAVAEHFDSADGLSGDFVEGLFEDREGNIWVTTTKGIDSFRDRSVVVFSKREGLTADSVSSVVASRKGVVWTGNVGSLDFVHDGKISSITPRRGLPGKVVTSLLEDHTGLLWVGVDNGLFVYQSGRFRPILKPDGQPIGFVERMIEDTDGDVWASVSGVSGRVVRIRNRKVVESTDPEIQHSLIVADPSGGIWLGLRNGDLARYRQNRMEQIPASPDARGGLLRLLLDSDHVVWGAASTGLVGWKKGKLQTLAVRNGLPCADIYAMVVDNQHALWLDAACGLIRIAATELQRWWEHPDAKVKVWVLDVFDGFQAGNPSFNPAVSRSPDGRLWFANESVLQMVDPAHLEGNILPPPVHVEQIIAGGKTYPAVGSVPLPTLTRDIEVDYTALSFVMPQRVRFRYKLEGHDTMWEDADTRRSAFYTNLRPAHYRFHVIACNNDGVWNEQGAVLDFIIPPAWYQTPWFVALGVLGVLGLCYLLYRRKVRQVAASMRIRFDERIEDRTRVARDLHDTLIQTIQGSKLVVDNARKGPPDLARMQKAVDLLSEWLDRAVMEGRAALSSLRGSTAEGNDLAEALRRACDDCRLRKFIDASFSLRGQSREIHPISRDEVYRIGYEAIQNACVHSGGSRIIAEIEYGPNLRLSVRDNGKGIDEETLRSGKTGHFGLTGMRERALRIGGRLTISSSAGGGTEVILLVPGRLIFRVI
jgi:signal transduction histidine kinase/streptogramin lyase